MPGIPDDRAIQVGAHISDSANYDTVVERVEYGSVSITAFGRNRLNNGQMIAYKTLRRGLMDDPQTRASFVRECLLWTGLWPHPNIVRAYSVLETGDGRPFLALEYAERGSLRTLLHLAARSRPGKRLLLELGLNLAQQIAAGLAYLHQPDPAYLRAEPIVHRDLKPENVLLMGGGRAAITNFGLIKAVEESPVTLALLLYESIAAQPGRQAEEAVLFVDDEATRTTAVRTAAGVAIGTLAYMAPEQWEDARHVGPAADIYALGIMLSEIIAGRHALLDLEQPHSQAEWRRAHRDPRPRSLREVAPEIPDVIDDVYRRCLARDPGDRPSASEVLAALQTCARAAAIEAYTPPEFMPHTPYNECVQWLHWSNAYFNFDLFHEALTRNDRAFALARELGSEQPELLTTVLTARGNILSALGSNALSQGDEAGATESDRQAEAAYQMALAVQLSVSTSEGLQSRAAIWSAIGVFNGQRKRYAHADDAYARALALKPDKAETYFARALSQAQWGLADEELDKRDSGIEHLRQARIYAATSLGMNYSAARSLLESIEATLGRLGVTD